MIFKIFEFVNRVLNLIRKLFVPVLEKSAHFDNLIIIWPFFSLILFYLTFKFDNLTLFLKVFIPLCMFLSSFFYFIRKDQDPNIKSFHLLSNFITIIMSFLWIHLLILILLDFIFLL